RVDAEQVDREVTAWSQQPVIEHLSAFAVADVIRSVDSTIEHVKEGIPMIVGVTAEDGIRVAIQARERAAFQANQVKQINGVEVELEITVVTEHLEGNRRDDLRRQKETVQIIRRRKAA